MSQLSTQVYRPRNGATVYWFWQDGKPAIETKFTDTGDIRQWTPEEMIKRYGDPRPALRNRPEVLGDAAQISESHVESRINHISSISYFRPSLDPVKGVLPGAIRTAQKGNSYGIKEVNDQMLAYQQAMDVAFTLCPEGENSNFVKEYSVSGAVGAWPNRPGDSTDPNNRTERKIMGPHGNFDRVGVDGKTYYYFNPRKDQPGDPWYKDLNKPVENKPETDKPVSLSGIKDLASQIQKLAFDPRVPANAGGVPAKNMRKIQPLVTQLLEKLK